MAAGSFLVSGAVLRDLLGLPSGVEVESVVVEVSCEAIKPGHDIAPTFHTVGGRMRLKSWNQTRRPKGRPLSPIERDLLQQQVDTLSKSLAFNRSIHRSYDREFSASAARDTVQVRLPKRYAR